MATVDGATAAINDIRYLPYGNIRDAGTIDDKGFLNQTHDPETGLIYLNNRYHDPTLATFISVDPLVTTTGEAHIYASGNPVTCSDPDGWLPSGAESDGSPVGGEGGQRRSFRPPRE